MSRYRNLEEALRNLPERYHAAIKAEFERRGPSTGLLARSTTEGDLAITLEPDGTTELRLTGTGIDFDPPPRTNYSGRRGEQEFTDDVRNELRRAGWIEYHTYRSTKSPPGFPDILAIKPRDATLYDRLIAAAEGEPTEFLTASGNRVFYGEPRSDGALLVAELKLRSPAHKHLTPPQRKWLLFFHLVTHLVFTWTPREWPEIRKWKRWPDLPPEEE